MKIKHRMIAVLLTLALLLGLFPIGVSATETAKGTCGDDANWILDSNGVLTISGTGTMESWTSSRDVPWYSYLSSIKTVIIEEGITTLTFASFFKCNNLTSVTMAKSVTTIQQEVFRGTSLREVNYRGTKADWGNIAISDYDIQSSYATDLVYATIYCTDGKIVPSGTCGDGLVWTLENTVLEISGEGAMTNYTSKNDTPWYYARELITAIQIDEGVASIGAYAFYETNISAISISDSVEEIGQYAFYGCGKLSDIILPDSVTTIGQGAFYDCASLTSIIIPDSVTSLGSSAFYGCTNLADITLSNQLSELGASLFSKCTSLHTIAIPNGVTKIASGTFSGCSHLTEVTIPDTVSYIGSAAFSGCTRLTGVVIPKGVTEIGDSRYQSTFYGCTSLKRIVFLGTAPTFYPTFEDTFNEQSEIEIYCDFSASGWDSVMAEAEEKAKYTWVDLAQLSEKDVLSISGPTNTVSVGESIQLAAMLDPRLAIVFSWTSSNPEVATVTINGKVSAWQEGTTVISCASTDGNYTATYSITVTASDVKTPKDFTTRLTGYVSDNVSDNNYTVWSDVVNSYLVEDADKNLIRVEYVSGEGVLVENYSPEFTLISTQLLPCPLELFGGFYSGEDAYYLVFGQENSSNSKECEVMRVIKYNKNWETLSSCSIYGANTSIPFDAGSLRMEEINHSLYLYTCHQMYNGHQANMTFVIDEETMTVTQSFCGVYDITRGYVSHSFNQFVQTDGTYVYRVDHGDCYPRAVTITRCREDGKISDVIYTHALDIDVGSGGDNATGVSVGGFALSSENCIIAGNSVMQNDSDSSASDQRNIFLTITDKALQGTDIVWLTNYTNEDGITPRTPQLVKLNNEQFLVLWEEYDKNSRSVSTKLVTVDGTGMPTSEVVSTSLRLSDCQPIVLSSGLVSWYVTDSSDLNLYTINPYDLSAIPRYIQGDVNGDGKVTFADYTKILSHVKKKTLLKDEELARADVNGDGKVTFADYAKVLAIVKKQG